jgi:hypothetical protein
MADVRIPRNGHRGLPLPPVCICCGRPADGTVVRYFLSLPRWAWTLVACGPGLGLLAAAIAFHQWGDWVRAELPVCRAHRRHWWAWDTLVAIGVVVGAALALGQIWKAAVGTDPLPDSQPARSLVVFGLLVFLGVWGLSFLVVYHLTVRSAAMDPVAVRLRNVSRKFAEAVEADPVCPKYGYDLRGNTSSRCPECGLPAAGPIPPEPRHG